MRLGMTMRGARPILAAVAALLLLASCATVPQRSSSQWLGALPSDATIYASLAVSGSAQFIKKALKDAGPGTQDLAALVDMTQRLVCSVTLANDAPARFSVLALGSYPSLFIGMRLAGNKEWARRTGPGGTYYEWIKPGLQVSFPNGGILLASNNGVASLLARWTSPVPLKVPPEVAADMESTDLVVYLPELPGGLARASATGVHIPIREIWMNAVKAKDGYHLTATANTSSETEAKLVNLVLRLGIVGWMRSQNVPNAAERLKSISVAAIGVQVKVTGLVFSEEEIIPMFLSLVKSIAPQPAADTPAAPAPADAMTPETSP
jgi:hypothetical protein